MANTEMHNVVVIHGTHHSFTPHPDAEKAKEGKGTRKKHEVGDELALSKAELLRLDPQFRNGMGERFASPEKAAKLNQKRALEAELEAKDDEIEGAEVDEQDDTEEDPEPDAAPTPPPPEAKAKKPRKLKP